MLIITDRTELDEQIEKVFKGVNEDIYRTTSGADLIAKLNATQPLADLLAGPQVWRKREDEDGSTPTLMFIEELKNALPPGFQGQGQPVMCSWTSAIALNPASCMRR